MTARKIAGFVVPSLFIALFAVGGQRPAAAVSSATLNSPLTCNLADVQLAKARFQSLSAYRRFNPEAVPMDAVMAASDAYIALAEACYDQLYETEIDQDGLRLSEEGLVAGRPRSSDWTLFGTKWPNGSTPWQHEGPDENGPRTAGGIVTWGFMPAGVDMTAEGPALAASTAFSALAGYSACFDTEIANAFAAWSAVSNIQFSGPVADAGLAFNDPGASAPHIRIGGHVFDGVSNTLAHAFFPSVGGTSTAPGDMHFDNAETWSCAPGTGVFDIGIVAMHEVGHAIGLGHETRFGGSFPRRALMNPFYNPAIVSALVGDDINGAENIYGSSVGNSPDAIIDFGPGFGIYILDYGVGFSPLHGLSPDQIVTGDLNGNGVDDIVIDFGAAAGVYARMDMTTWVPLHALSPTHMAIGDIDNTGRDDVVMNFAGAGLWAFMNNSAFQNIHGLNSTLFEIGNLDNNTGDDIVAVFPGAGTWRRQITGTWVQQHPLDATRIVIGDFNESAALGDEADDLILGFAGAGIWLFQDPGRTAPAPPAPVMVHGTVPARMAAGDMERDGRDELVADFGPGIGLYVWEFGPAGWAPLLPQTAQELRFGDLDGNGQVDLISDFGAAGLWVFVNNTSWVHVHGFNVEGIAVGDLD
jgi:hypothetical protein